MSSVLSVVNNHGFPWLDYNTRAVLLGTGLLGAAAGLVGTYLVLRKRALIGDAVGHATLPGIAIAFLTAEAFVPGSGKQTWVLTLGATLTGVGGAAAIASLSRARRVGPDTAQAAVLGLFFGVGAALFQIIQQIPTGNAAGLNGYLYGKAASLVIGDAWFFATAASAILIAIVAFHKEFVLLCFDPEYARATGVPVRRLDLLLTGLAVAITVLGLQSVGLVLVVATLTIPPAAARFWTNRAGVMAVLSATLGALAAIVGVMLSANIPKLATGATIVVTMGTLFALSLVVGPHGGLLARRIRSFVGNRES